MKRDDLDLNYFKEKLSKELEVLRAELKSVGRVNPDNPEDWEATPAKMDVSSSDINETADSIEEYETNAAVLSALEIQFNDVERALDEIEKGNYGYCEICKEPIPKERLEVNPSARTCLKHDGK